MPRNAALLRRNALAFPAGVAPGIDPNHIALKSGGICRFSGVATGGSFVELQQGIPGALQSTANAEIGSGTGPAIRATASGEYVKFAGLKRAILTSEPAFTLAAIFKYTNTAGGRDTLFGTSTLVNSGFAIGTGLSAGVPWVAGPGQSETSFSNLPTFIPGHTYFFAATAAAKGIVVDLTTGRVATDAGASIIGLFPTDGNYAVGASPNQGGALGVGSVAAACHINKNLSAQELIAWAQDPWAFWYPRAAVQGFTIADVVTSSGVALSASARLSVAGRATIAGAAGLTAAASVKVKASAGIAGSVSLAAATKIAVYARLVPPGALALVAAAFLKVTGRGAMQGTASVQGRTSLKVTASAKAAGATGLSGRAKIASSARASGPQMLMALAARTFLKLTGNASPQGATSLQGRATLQSKASGATTAVAALAARTKIAIGTASTMSAATLLSVSVGARTAIRVFARGVLSKFIVPRPTPYAARDSKVSSAIDKFFGEQFTFIAFTPGGDVNLPKAADMARPSFDATAVWEAPAKAQAPHARGSIQDDTAHSWNASMPSVSIDISNLKWLPVPGDRITRQFDGSVYQISAALPDGMGRAILLLTGRKR